MERNQSVKPFFSLTNSCESCLLGTYTNIKIYVYFLSCSHNKLSPTVSHLFVSIKKTVHEKCLRKILDCLLWFHKMPVTAVL